jgi:hypothetical protein
MARFSSLAVTTLGFTTLYLSALLVACGPASQGARAPEAEKAPSLLAVGSPPTPKATDWKGLFDSDSQSRSMAPPPALATAVLQQEPDCSSVDTWATGSFSGINRDETAYLLTCGATRRLVLRTEQAKLASLDVSEDTLGDAGDLDLDGPHELFLLGHAAGATSIRVLRFNAGKLVPIYALTSPPDPCSHTIIYYRLLAPNMEYRVDKLPKRCTP